MTPAYQPVSLGRAVRGPIMLLLIGVLFACDHFTEYNIGRTWPLVLIVFGLLLLLTRVRQASPSPPAPPVVTGNQGGLS
jgi:hypothetical protein